MKDEQLDPSVKIAFSELAWLLFLGVVLFGGYGMVKYNKIIAQKDIKIDEYANKITEIEPNDPTDTAMTRRFEAMQKELDRLKLLEKEYTAMTKRLEVMQKELDRLKLIEKEYTAMTKELGRLKLIEKKYEEIVKKFPDVNSLKDLASLGIEQQKNTDLQKQISQLMKALAIARKSDTLVRKELLGLKGPMQNVVFILDKSYSMNSDKRWDKTCDIVETWLTYLNVEGCILVLFSDGIRVISNDKEKTNPYLEMVGEKRPANLKGLLNKLKKVKPSGRTNTYKAIKKAMEYEPDTIILFTDGAPIGTFHFGKYDEKQMNTILKEFSKEHMPINIVALGDYFDQRLCQFLRELADSTGGSFLGK